MKKLKKVDLPMNPRGIFGDHEGNLFVCDQNKRCAHMFPHPYDGVNKSSYFAKGNECEFIVSPSYIAVSQDGRIAISDQEHHCVYEYHDRKVSKIGGPGKDEGLFDMPCGLVFGLNGYLIVADSYNNRLQIFDQNGRFVEAVGCFGSELGEFKNPKGLTVNESRDMLFVCDTGNNRIQVFSLHTLPRHNIGEDKLVWV